MSNGIPSWPIWYIRTDEPYPADIYSLGQGGSRKKVLLLFSNEKEAKEIVTENEGFCAESIGEKDWPSFLADARKRGLEEYAIDMPPFSPKSKIRWGKPTVSIQKTLEELDADI